jgi:hypothetical protein
LLGRIFSGNYILQIETNDFAKGKRRDAGVGRLFLMMFFGRFIGRMPEVIARRGLSFLTRWDD